jgi:putative SOS response-associated peptidase YedK
MCGRYRRTTQEEELARLYHIPIPKQTDLPISYNIAPSQKVLTIRFNPEIQQRSLDALQWGLIPYWGNGRDAAIRRNRRLLPETANLLDANPCS